MESITDWAFSCPISMCAVSLKLSMWVLMKHQRMETICSEWDSGRTLVIVEHISFVVTSSIVCFPYRHRVMCEINIAVVAYNQMSMSDKSWTQQSFESYARDK